jgi:4-aminobutyrate aminotransferase-like enzyme
MRYVCLILLIAIVGCGVRGSSPTERSRQHRPVKPDQTIEKPAAFDAAECAAELAHQAELANESPAFLASEILDGILNQAGASGIPADFVQRVRKACPAIGAIPASDLTEAQVKAIREVR